MKRLACVLVLALVMTLGLVGTASAHTSSYCGHGSAGWVDRVVFVRHWDNGIFIHVHAYYHYRLTWSGYAFQHTEVKRCPPHIHRWN